MQDWQASSRTSIRASPTPSASAGINVAQERKQTIADIRQELRGDPVAAAQAVDWSAEAGWALVNTLLLGECLCSAKGLQSCACDMSIEVGRALADTLLLGECCSCREAAEGPGRPVWPMVLTLAALGTTCRCWVDASAPRGSGCLCLQDLCLQHLWGWLSFVGHQSTCGCSCSGKVSQSSCACLPEVDPGEPSD